VISRLLASLGLMKTYKQLQRSKPQHGMQQLTIVAPSTVLAAVSSSPLIPNHTRKQPRLTALATEPIRV
jgi:hypothetical protein